MIVFGESIVLNETINCIAGEKIEITFTPEEIFSDGIDPIITSISGNFTDFSYQRILNYEISYSVSDYVQAMVYNEGYLYVAAARAGIQFINLELNTVSDPREVFEGDPSTDVQDLVLSSTKDKIFVSEYQNGIAVMKINPKTDTDVHSITERLLNQGTDSQDYTRIAYIDGDHFYVCKYNDGFAQFTATGMTSIQQGIGYITSEIDIIDIELSKNKNFMYVAVQNYGIKVISITADNFLILSNTYGSPYSNYVHLVRNDEILYALVQDYGIVKFSVQVENDPQFIDSIKLGNANVLTKLKIIDDLIFVSSDYGAHIVKDHSTDGLELIGEWNKISNSDSILTIEANKKFVFYGDEDNGVFKIDYSIHKYFDGVCKNEQRNFEVKVCELENESNCITKTYKLIGECGDSIDCGINGSPNDFCLCQCNDGYYGNNCEHKEDSGECNGVAIGSFFCLNYSILIISTSSILGILLILFFLIGLIISIIFCVLLKRAKRFDHIPDIELISKEAKLEQQETTDSNRFTPKFKFNNEDYLINYKDIELLKNIAQGGSNSSIFLAKWKGQELIYKGFHVSNVYGTSTNNDETYSEFEKEIKFCVGLNHPNIIRFYGACINPPKLGILMEFCINGDVPTYFSNYSKKNNKIGSIPLTKKMQIIKEITSAMEYLHQKDIIHRDLKPENILINGEEKSKIIDFGLSKFLKKKTTENQTMTACIGTSFYMSPEVYLGKSYSFPADVYSWSILVLTIISENFHPYGIGVDERSMKNAATNPSFRPKINSKDFKNCQFLIPLIKKNWNHNPEDRNTFSKIRQTLEKEKITKEVKKRSRPPPPPKKRK